jgi:hypothetical protein
LGHYHDDGEFVTAIREGAVCLPRLYAASRTDRDWWISEKDFRRMYTAAGGFLQGGRLAWRGDVSSSR